MSLPPMQNDDETSEITGQSLGAYGRARGRRFRGIIDFGAFGSESAPTPFEQDQARDWLKDYTNYKATGMESGAAANLANIAHPYAMDGVAGRRTALGTLLDTEAAKKATADAQLKANVVSASTEAARVGTQTAAQIAQSQMQANGGGTARITADGRVVMDPAGTAPHEDTIVGGGDNTMMYVGAAVVGLGLLFASRKRGGGSMAGYSRRKGRKARRSRKSRR